MTREGERCNFILAVVEITKEAEEYSVLLKDFFRWVRSHFVIRIENAPVVFPLGKMRKNFAYFPTRRVQSC